MLNELEKDVDHARKFFDAAGPPTADELKSFFPYSSNPAADRREAQLEQTVVFTFYDWLEDVEGLS